MSTLAGPDLLDYAVVDVFSEQPFAGNPLAVVLGGEALTGGQMAALAREFNLSETTFPLPPTPRSGADYRVRIFTPGTELPFAGHPSIGTAWLLSRLGRLPAEGEVRQECGAGVLPLRLEPSGVTLTGAAPTLGRLLEPDALLAAVGLEPVDLDPLAAPGIAGAGLDFAFLPVRREAVDRAVADPRALREAGAGNLVVFAWADGRAYARVFAVDAGVAEDPATGSAALALGAWLVAAGALPGDAVSSYSIEQGVRMLRPSRLHGSVAATGGRAVSCSVTGSVVLVAEGCIVRPG